MSRFRRAVWATAAAAAAAVGSVAMASSVSGSASVLGLADFDTTGLEVEASALFVAGSAGGEAALYAAAGSRWAVSGSLAEGELSLGAERSPVVRVMSIDSGEVLRFNDSGALVLRDYFGPAGDGADLTVWVQTVDAAASFPVSGLVSAGSNYVNFAVAEPARSLLGGIEDGDRFIVALTRPAPDLPLAEVIVFDDDPVDDPPLVSSQSSDDETLLSNYSRAASASVFPVVGGADSTRQAMRFTTGSDTGGYYIRQIVINAFGIGSESLAQLEIHSSTESPSSDPPTAAPDALLHTFAPEALPSGLNAISEVEFTPSSQVTLDPDTSYWIVLSGSGTEWEPYVHEDSAASHADSGSAAGWSFHGRSTTSGSTWSSIDVGPSDTYQHFVAEIRTDATPPALDSAELGADGGTLTLTFDDAFAVPSDSAMRDAFYIELSKRFSATVDGSANAVGPGLGSDPPAGVLELMFEQTVTVGQEVVVTYTDPTAVDDANVVEDAVGNDTATFVTGQDGVPAVVNNSAVNSAATKPPALVGAEVNAAGNEIALTFDQTYAAPSGDAALAAFYAALGGRFAVTAVSEVSGTVSASTASVRSARSDPAAGTLALGLSGVVHSRHTVVVAYTDPTSGDDSDVIEGLGGLESPTFATGRGGVPSVINSSAVVPPAADSVVLLENFGEASSGSFGVGGLNRDQWAVRFITGPEAALVDSIVLDVHSTGHESTMRIFSATETPATSSEVRRSVPNTALHTFSAPSPFGTGPQAFTPNAEVRLEADTAYWVVLTGTNFIGSRWSFKTNSPTAAHADSGAWSIHGAATRAQPGNAPLVGWSSVSVGPGNRYTHPRISIRGRELDRSPPALTSARVVTGGHQIELVFDEPFVVPSQAWWAALAYRFAVTADTATVPVSVDTAASDASAGKLVLRPAQLIRKHHSVVVAYTDPHQADDANVIQDHLGQETASFTTGQSGVPAVTNNESKCVPTQTLVSNTFLSLDGEHGQSPQGLRRAAMRFTTGPQPEGFSVRQVVVDVAGLVDGGALSLRIFSSAESPGSDPPAAAPDAALYTFRAPETISVGRQTFTAPSCDVVLDPDTAYWIVLSPIGGGVRLWQNRHTGSYADAVSLADWSFHGFASTQGATWPAVEVGHTDEHRHFRASIVGSPLGVAAPTLAAAEVSGDGTSLTMRFTDELRAPSDYENLDDYFDVSVGGALREFTMPADAQKPAEGQYTLRFATPIARRQDVVVTYTAPEGDFSDVVADLGGVDAATFTTGAGGLPRVVNRSTVAPPVATLLSNTRNRVLNTTRSISVGGTTGRLAAVRFNTGALPGEYAIDSIDIDVASGSDSSMPQLRIFSSDETADTARPDKPLHTFAAPSGFGAGLQTFSPSDRGARLKPDTAYWLVMSSGGNASWAAKRFSSARGEHADEFSQTGWSFEGAASRTGTNFWNAVGVEATDQYSFPPITLRGAPGATLEPWLTSATVNAAGSHIDLVFDRAYAWDHDFNYEFNFTRELPHRFSVTADAASVAFLVDVDRTVPSAGKLSFEFGSRIRKDQAVVLTYADPTPNDDSIVIEHPTSGDESATFTTGQGGHPAVRNFSRVVPGAFLLSNLDKLSHATNFLLIGEETTLRQAVRFTTGAAELGYNVDEIIVDFFQYNPDRDARLEIWSSAESPSSDPPTAMPDAPLWAFAPRRYPRSSTVLIGFTALSKVTLDPNTSYWIVLSGSDRPYDDREGSSDTSLEVWATLDPTVSYAGSGSADGWSFHGIATTSGSSWPSVDVGPTKTYTHIRTHITGAPFDLDNRELATNVRQAAGPDVATSRALDSLAQGFTTGSHPDGYFLSAVDVGLSTAVGVDAEVTLWSSRRDDVSGSVAGDGHSRGYFIDYPLKPVVTLTQRTVIDDDAATLERFTANDKDVLLLPDTTYFVVVSRALGPRVGLSAGTVSPAGAVDGGGLEGFSLGDGVWVGQVAGAGPGGVWVSDDWGDRVARSLKIRLTGGEAGPRPPGPYDTNRNFQRWAVPAVTGSSVSRYATSFTPGLAGFGSPANVSALEVTSVLLSVAAEAGVTPRVAIHADASGSPAAMALSGGMLTAPDEVSRTLSEPGRALFTLDTPLSLNLWSKYWVVLDVGSGSGNLSVSTTASDDGDGYTYGHGRNATDDYFSEIGHTMKSYSGSSWSDDSGGRSFRMAVNGTTDPFRGATLFVGLPQVGVGTGAFVDDTSGRERNWTWRWQRGGARGGPFADIPAAQGGTDRSYVPVSADLGKWLKLVATYDDAYGTGSTVSRVARQPVQSRPTVSNVGEYEVIYGLLESNKDDLSLAQAFRTGGKPGGYVLEALRFGLNVDTATETLSWALHADDSGRPAAEPLFDPISVPASLLDEDSDTFEDLSHPGFVLEPDTVYWALLTSKKVVTGVDQFITAAKVSEWGERRYMPPSEPSAPLAPGSEPGWALLAHTLSNGEKPLWRLHMTDLELPGRSVLRMSVLTRAAGPTLASAAVDASGDTLTLTFDKPYAAPTGTAMLAAFHTALAARFGVTADSLGVGTTVSAAGSDPAAGTLALSLGKTVTAGQAVAVSYTDPTGGDDSDVIEDADGNETVTFTTGLGGVVAVVNNSTAAPRADTTAPTLLRARVDPSGASVTLDFSEALEGASGPAAATLFDALDSRFSVTAGGAAVGVTVDEASRLDLATVVLVVSGRRVGTGQAVVVSYSDLSAGDDASGVLQDLAGNDAAAFTTGLGGVPAVVNDSTADPSAPTLVSATVSEAGDVLTLVFSDAFAVPADAAMAAAFHTALGDRLEVTADTVPIPSQVSAADSDPASGTLVLSFSTIDADDNEVVSTIAHGRDVVVAYTDPTAGDDPDVIETAAGKEAATFVTGEAWVPTVTNNSTRLLFNIHAPAGADPGTANQIGGSTEQRYGSRFATGAHLPGYSISQITIHVDSAGGTDTVPGLELWSSTESRNFQGDPTAGPNELLHTLTAPDDFGTGRQTFKAPPSGVTLDPGTKYWIVLSGTGTSWSAATRSRAQLHADRLSAHGWSFFGKASTTSDSWSTVFVDTDLSWYQHIRTEIEGSEIPPDITAPTLSSANVDTTGTTLTLTFDEAYAVPSDRAMLTAYWTALAGRFGVTVAGSTVTATADASGSDPAAGTVALSLTTAVEMDQQVKVVYTDPTAGDDSNVIEDASGNEVDTFTTGKNHVPDVDNNSTVPRTRFELMSATVAADGTSVTLVFSRALMGPGVGATSAERMAFFAELANRFDVTAIPGNPDVEVESVDSIGGMAMTTVTMTLDGPAFQGAEVVITYADPDPAGDDADGVLQDVDGEDMESFTTGQGMVPAVTNDSTYVGVPVMVSFAKAAYSAIEGGKAVTVTVRLDADPERTLTIPITATDQGTTTSADYTLSSTSVTFNPGDTAATVTFSAEADDDDEDPDETVRLGFATPLPAAVTSGTPAHTTITITQGCPVIFCATVTFDKYYEDPDNGRRFLRRAGPPRSPNSSFVAAADDRFAHDKKNYLFADAWLRHGPSGTAAERLPWAIPERATLEISLLNFDAVTPQFSAGDLDPTARPYWWHMPNDDYLDWALVVSADVAGVTKEITLAYSEARHWGSNRWRWYGSDLHQLTSAWAAGKEFELRIESDPRSGRTAAAPGPPLQLHGALVSARSAVMHWIRPQQRDDSTPADLSYKIQWKLSTTPSWDTPGAVTERVFAQEPDAARITATIRDLTPDSRYDVRVFAIHDSTQSNTAAETQIHTGPGP